MKRVIAVSAMTAMIAFGASSALAANSYAGADANQWLNADGYSFAAPHFGTTAQEASLTQTEWGYAYNGTVNDEQFGTQLHEYGSFGSSSSGYTGQHGYNEQTAGMEGSVDGYGVFDTFSDIDYGSTIVTGNQGPYAMGSNMSEGFDLSVGGSAWGWADTSNFASLEAENDFAQYATNGEDFAYQAGSSGIHAWGNGAATYCGDYGANVNGYQNLGIYTSMDGNGNAMSGSIGASSHLQATENSYGNAGASAGAYAHQQGMYEQYNEGANGYQFSSGSINTSTYISN